MRATRPVRFVIRHRHLGHWAIDSAAWLVGLAFSTLVRLDFVVTELDVVGLVTILPFALAAQAGTGVLTGLYLGRARFGSFDEVAALARSVILATPVVFAANLLLGDPRPVPLTATLSGGVVALVVMGGVRYVWRLALEARLRPHGDGLTRLVVFGAGEGGQQVVTAMLRDPASPYIPVALLDDDHGKRHLRLSGVPVMGTRHSIADLSATADALLVAIPSAPASLISEISALAEQAGLPVKVLPPVRDLFGNVTLGDIRDVTDADLLGRHEVETDLASIAGYLTGHRVLVTGAGGFIGSELCRQIYAYAPSALVMLDRDESALHSVQLSLDGRGLLDSRDLVVADIRDAERVMEVFSEHRPEVVFHAAALKHVPLLEMHPCEAAKTNVFGTLHVLEAAAKMGVHRFVNISTDKAADPASVLGYTKRITERLTSWFSREHEGTYLSVRFGNVLGSRGSVLPAFHAQIAAGGPVTVTSPEVTRYFMTVQEAVQLVIQAAAIGRDNEALVLDMGDPIRIDAVARRLIAAADRPIDIVYTGLRPGEKLHEALLGENEVDDRPVHPLVSQVRVDPISPLALAVDLWGECELLTKQLAALAASEPDTATRPAGPESSPVL